MTAHGHGTFTLPVQGGKVKDTLCTCEFPIVRMRLGCTLCLGAVCQGTQDISRRELREFSDVVVGAMMHQVTLTNFNLSAKTVANLVNEANSKFGSDFKLVGSWATKGYSSHYIDVVTQNKSGNNDAEIKVAKYIVEKTNMVVDVWLGWVYKGLYRNICFLPNGSWGYAHDFSLEEVFHLKHVNPDEEAAP